MSVEELMQKISDEAEKIMCLYCIRDIRSDQGMKSIREELARYLGNREKVGHGYKWIYRRPKECGMLITITLNNQPNGLELVLVDARCSE